LHLHPHEWVAVRVQYFSRNDALRSHFNSHILHLHSRRQHERRPRRRVRSRAVTGGYESRFIGRQRVAAGSHVIKGKFASVVRGFNVAGRRLAGLRRSTLQANSGFPNHVAIQAEDGALHANSLLCGVRRRRRGRGRVLGDRQGRGQEHNQPEPAHADSSLSHDITNDLDALRAPRVPGRRNYFGNNSDTRRF